MLVLCGTSVKINEKNKKEYIKNKTNLCRSNRRMDFNSAPKRCRASAEQLNYMADFMLENKGLAGGKFQKMHGKLEVQKKWEELAGRLNSFGGAVKSVDQWHTVWRDLKSRTSLKVRDRKRQQALTGNRPILQEPVTELEKRVISLVGKEYIEGSEVLAENVPISEELQLRMEEGDDDIFDDLASASVNAELASTPLRNTPQRSRQKKKWTYTEEVQDKFLEIAKQQADSLKMLAESNTANCEATKKMAEAITVMGEGLKHMADAVNNLAKSINGQ